MLRYFTSGESHGEALVAFLSGLPAGLMVEQAFLDRELWRRQQGYGRGGRMKIERDTARILSGVRQGRTIGSPIAILLENKDWKNWQEALPVELGDPAKHKRVASPRPGHADLAGALKYNFPEARYVLERASARESAARVAIGGLAKLFLRELGTEVLSHVVAVGSATITATSAFALAIVDVPPPSLGAPPSCHGADPDELVTLYNAEEGETDTRGFGSGVSSGSTCSRRCSNAGGRESRSPRCSRGSSVVKPGPIVAISNRTPLGSRK